MTIRIEFWRWTGQMDGCIGGQASTCTHNSNSPRTTQDRKCINKFKHKRRMPQKHQQERRMLDLLERFDALRRFCRRWRLIPGYAGVDGAGPGVDAAGEGLGVGKALFA